MSEAEISKVRETAKVKLFAWFVFFVLIVGLLFEWMYQNQPLAETVLIYSGAGQEKTTETITLEVTPAESTTEVIVVETIPEVSAENVAPVEVKEDALNDFIGYMHQVEEDAAKELPSETVLDKIKLPEGVPTPMVNESEPTVVENVPAPKVEEANAPQPATEENKVEETQPIENKPEPEKVEAVTEEAPAEAKEENAPSENVEEKPAEAPVEPTKSESFDENAPVMLIPGMAQGNTVSEKQP